MLFFYSSSFANVNDSYIFTNNKQVAQFHHLCKQFRCLVCQNESLAESNAPLAKDLRFQIYKMIKTNKTDDEIVNFLLNRYGDFILYHPTLSSYNLLLWLIPLLMLIAALSRLGWLIYRRRKSTVYDKSNYHFSKRDREKIKHLLREH